MAQLDSSSTLSVLARSLPVSVFEAGGVLIHEGPNQGILYFLAEGELSVEKGGVEVARIVDPGAVVGEIAALLGLGHSATVRARGAARVYRCEAPEQFLRDHPDLLFHVAQLLARRLVDATTYLSDIKRQYADRDDHLGMVEEVLSALVNQQTPDVRVVPRPRRPDPRL